MDRSLPDLTGSVVLVTGAGGGIGSGIAERVAAAGAAVVVHHRTGADRAGEVAAAVDTNLTGAFATVQAAVAVMRHGGSVTLVASIEGTRPARVHAHYAAAKAGMIMFARSAALEYGGSGIRVNTVSPGLIHRDGLEDAWSDGVASWRRAAPLGRLGEASDVGDACVFLASPMARWITGHDLVVDGGMSAAPPW